MTDLAAIVAAAAAALTAAQDAQVEANDAHLAAKEDNKAFTASVAEAKANVKKASDYLSGLPAEATDEQKAEAQSLLDGWKAAQVQREAAVVTNKALIASTKAALAAADKALKAAKKESEKANKPAKEAKVAAVRDVQNGQKRPDKEGPSTTVWAIFDAATAAAEGKPVALADVFDQCIAAGVREATTRSAYAHWRKYHGITGRVVSNTHAQKEAAKVAEKAAKEAKKLADKEAKAAATAAAKAAKEAEAKAKAEAAKAAADAAAAAAAAAAQTATA